MFRFACSVVLREGRCAADKCHWCVWGALAVFLPHWVLPRSRVCALPVYTAQAPSCSIWSGLGPALHVVPVFGYSTKVQAWLDLHFVPSPARAAQAARSLTGSLSLGAVRLLPSAGPASVSTLAGRVREASVCSWELASSRDPPGGCRPSRISGSLWLETGGLFAVW